jgi:hypothetical protein
MGRLDQLPPDQRAVLQLLLKQGKSYDEIATLLRIDRSAVQARAHEALDALGPEDAAADLPPARQNEVGDHLLGQQDASHQQATRTFLEGSAPGRAWARVVSSELRELSPGALPEIPAEGAAELDEAFDALEARKAARDEHERSSKLGGILLLVGLGIAVAVALVLVLNGGGKDKKPTGPVGGGTTTTPASTSTNAATTPTVEAQVNLFPPGGGKKPLGVANVVSQQGQRGIALVGQSLPATGGKFAYAMWLQNATSAKRLGFFPAVKADGRMQGFVLAPTDFATYTKLLVTRETARNPKVPGPVVLTGNLPKK